MGTTITRNGRQNLAGALKTITATLGLAFTATTATADDWAIKSNLLMDGLYNPNLGVEWAFAPKWSVDVNGQFNFWNLSHDRKWKHWIAQPELRYWFCQALDGHFIGVHALGGQYNMGHVDLPFSFLGTDFREFKDNRHQGWMAGAGIAYGYSWALAKHWNLEAELGIGWAYTKYDVYECAGCGRKTETDKTHNYFGPTKAAINLVYVF